MATIERTPHGTYRARWRNPQGQTRSRSLKTRKDATNYLRAIQSDLHTGHYTDPQAGKARLTDWINEWHTGRIGLRPTTTARDATIINNLINPHLGDTQLRRLAPATIRTWVRAITETHAPATVAKAHQILKAALQAAVTDRLIPTNPATGTPLPRLDKPEPRYLAIDEIHRLAAAIDPRYKAVIYVGALAGLRPGEIAGLHIDDLDLLRKTLRVERTSSEISGRIVVGPPKTESSRRTISIPNVLVDILAEHLAAHPTDSPHVFTNTAEKPIRWTNLRRRAWRQAVLASVGQPCTPHVLRHSHAALCIQEGMHPRMLMERMGHRDIRTTLGTYGHVYSGYDEQVVNALDEAFSTQPVSDLRQKRSGDVIQLPAQ